MKLSLLVAACFSLLLTGCSAIKGLSKDVLQPNSPDTQAEAGRVYISAYPPLAWSDIASKLSPEFDEDSAKDLLTKVLPITQSDDISFRRGFAAGLEANLAGTEAISSSVLNRTTNEQTGEVTSATRTDESTESRSSGERPDIDPSAPSFESRAALAGAAQGVDPFIQYRAAAALYQEIQLLNEYLKARVADENLDAYLFRARVTLHPFARRQPLDVYTRIWVQSVLCKDTDNKPTKARRDIELCKKDGKEDGFVERYARPTVVPLLITDNFERNDTRRIEQAIRQIEANVSALVSGAGLGAGIESVRDELRQLRGSEFNNLQSIAQYDQNKLLVRFGGAYSPNSQYEMRPQTYDVAFVVLVPKATKMQNDTWSTKKKSRRMIIYESSSFRNARNGKPLPQVDRNYLSSMTSQISQRMRNWNFSKESRRCARDLAADFRFEDIRWVLQSPNQKPKDKRKACQSDDTQLPESCVRSWRCDGEKGRIVFDFPTLYDFIDDFQDINHLSSVIVDLPPTNPVLPPAQTASLRDINNRGSIVRLAGSKRINNTSQLIATLIVTDEDETPSKSYKLSAESFSVSKTGVLEITFPSLSAHELPNDNLRLLVGHKVANSDAKCGLRDATKGGTNSAAYYCSYPSVVVNAPASRPAIQPQVFNFAGLHSRILMKDGEGTARVLIQPGNKSFVPKGGYRIIVENALVKDDGAGADMSTNSYVFTTAGVHNLSVLNINSGDTVRLRAYALNEEKRPLADVTHPDPVSFVVDTAN